MITPTLRACILVPLALLAVVAFGVALLTEWLDDLSHTCPDPEKLP